MFADRHLFALLRHSRGPELDAPRELLSVIRAAAAHEELRADAVGAAASESLARLEQAGVEPIVIGEAALAWGSYPAPALRHCGIVELLVHPACRDTAKAALSELQCLEDGRSLRLRHPSGTLVSIHTALHRDPRRRAPNDIRALATKLGLAGRPALAPGPADQLVELCANAAAISGPGLRLLADGFFVCNRSDLDWERVLAHARLARATPALSDLLELLADRLDSELPPAPRAALRRSARQARARTLLVRAPRGAARRARRAWREVRA